MKKRKRDQVKGLEVGADELLAGEQNSVTATVRDEAGDPLSRELVTRAYEHTDSRTDGDNCANGHTRVGANDDTYVNEHTRADVQVLPLPTCCGAERIVGARPCRWFRQADQPTTKDRHTGFLVD